MSELENKQDGYIKDDSFMVFCPVEILEKSNKDEDPYKDCHIKGIASTEDRDIQSEILKSNGLNVSALNEGRGIFNYDHKEGPENVIGKIEGAEITDQGLHVEGYLFKNHDRGKAFLQILKSLKPKDKHRIQMSVEGKILERSGIDHKIITKANITKVALTLDPVNPKTYTELVKSFMAGDAPISYPNNVATTLKEGQEELKKDKKKEKKEVKKSEHNDKPAEDSIRVNSSLMMRLLEWAKEDVEKDVDMHKALERALELSKGNKILKMEDYNTITGTLQKEENKEEVLEKDKDIEKSENKEEESDYLVKKLDETLKTLIKTLSVGNAYTVAPGDMVGGAALTKESLIGSTKRKRRKKKKHKKKDKSELEKGVSDEKGITQENIKIDSAAHKRNEFKEKFAKLKAKQKLAKLKI